MNKLITKSLAEGVVTLLFSFPKELLSKHEVKLVEWVSAYTSRFGQPPTVERLMEEYSSFLPDSTEDPLADVYEQTLVRKRNIYVREYMTKIQEDLKAGKDPLPYIEELHKNIRHGASDVVRYSTFDRTSYIRKPTSFPYGIPQIDRYTGGISQGDLVYLIGRLGTGKTTFALWEVSKWLMNNMRILMVSNENRADDVIAKIDSYIGGFNPLKKRTLEWSEDDISRLSTVSFIARSISGEVYIPNKPVKDVEEINNLVYTYQPDIVLIDGIYLMRGVSGDSHWEKITNVSRSLKQLAEEQAVPVIGIHQANRNAIGKRIEVEHIAYADALAQDADLLLAINPEEDGSVFIEAIKNRWGKDNWGFFARFFFDTMSVKILDPKTETKEE